jgi:hypothetical protein
MNAFVRSVFDVSLFMMQIYRLVLISYHPAAIFDYILFKHFQP